MFDISLNDVIVVKDLDIFDKVGRGVAHDEIIPFKIKSNKLIIEDKTIPFNNEIRVEFIKVCDAHVVLLFSVILKITTESFLLLLSRMIKIIQRLMQLLSWKEHPIVSLGFIFYFFSKENGFLLIFT